MGQSAYMVTTWTGTQIQSAPTATRTRIPIVIAIDNETLVPAQPSSPTSPSAFQDEHGYTLDQTQTYESPSPSTSARTDADTGTADDVCRQLGREPITDDIRVEPHPRNAAGLKTRYFAYEEYSSEMPEPATTNSSSGKEETGIPDPSPSDSKRPPWSPFRTRIDFEFAELMESIHPNARTLDAVVKLVRKIIKNPSEFTFVDGKHITRTWESATKAHGNGVSISQYDSVDIDFKLDSLYLPT